jgi:Domain of unknown function (DUF4384)
MNVARRERRSLAPPLGVRAGRASRKGWRMRGALCTAAALLSLAAPALAAGKIGFEYSLEQENGGGAGEASFLRGFDMGEGVRIEVKLGQPSYCYMIARDEEGQFSLTFPDPKAGGKGPYQEARAKIPKSTFKIQQASGVERLYLIVSSDRIPEIEKVLDQGKSRVSEKLALEIRDKYQGVGSYERKVATQGVKVTWEPDDSHPAVVVEEVSIRAR